MALIIEDGSIVADANSYATAAELVAWAESVGETYPATEAEQEQLLLQSMFMFYEYCWAGTRVSSDQTLDFPRSSMLVNGFYFPSDEIPEDIKTAQMSWAITANTNDLFPSQSAGSGDVIEERVEGAITIKYETGTSGRDIASDPRANAVISEYRCNSGRGGLIGFGIRA